MSIRDRIYLRLWRGRNSLRRFKRIAVWPWKYRHTPPAEMVHFSCNICGHRNSLPRYEMGRESGACIFCGASVRWRSIIYALSMEIFGQNLSLDNFPVRKDIRGVGLSDWLGYAIPLAKKFDYKNTFYHRQPLLDIGHPDPAEFGQYNFLISTDVFEHVPPPVASAFAGASKLLKPGGVMIFSVPCVAGLTQEHFPELHRFTVEKKGDTWILINETADGRRQEFEDLNFHGGPGTTLEMRVFGEQSLRAHCEEAQFERIRTYSNEVPESGILWIDYDPLTAPYHPPILGLDAPPWAAHRSLDKN